MRLWSLHPKYLDARGLVALWREALLAQAVLRGETRGYKAHPQLDRFRAHSRPRVAVNEYLRAVCAEATRRGYRFDSRKIGRSRTNDRLAVTRGQLEYEWEHLMRKLKTRAPHMHAQWRSIALPDAHPSFRVVRGSVATWERRIERV